MRSMKTARGAAPVNAGPSRKKDKRSIATEHAIKCAMLEGLENSSFDQLTVSALCSQASISRATFYQHYKNTMEVLDELLGDMMSEMGDVPFEMCEACASSGYRPSPEFVWTGVPFCHFLASSNKYRSLLEDGSVAEMLIERLVDSSLDEMVSRLHERFPETKVDRGQLRYFNIFRMSGCLAAAKAAKRNGYDWARVQPTLDAAIAAAFQTLK